MLFRIATRYGTTKPSATEIIASVGISPSLADELLNLPHLDSRGICKIVYFFCFWMLIYVRCIAGCSIYLVMGTTVFEEEQSRSAGFMEASFKIEASSILNGRHLVATGLPVRID